MRNKRIYNQKAGQRDVARSLNVPSMRRFPSQPDRHCDVTTHNLWSAPIYPHLFRPTLHHDGRHVTDARMTANLTVCLEKQVFRSGQVSRVEGRVTLPEIMKMCFVFAGQNTWSGASSDARKTGFRFYGSRNTGRRFVNNRKIAFCGVVFAACQSNLLCVPTSPAPWNIVWKQVL